MSSPSRTQRWLQFAITLCAIALLVTPTLGENGAPGIFLSYRTLLVLIAALSAIGTQKYGTRISPAFLAGVAVFLLLALISLFRIDGSHFEAFSILYRHAFFLVAFLAFAHWCRYQSIRWKRLLLAAVVAVDLVYLVPDLFRSARPVAGFSYFNPDYFGTYLLIGLAACVAGAVFGTETKWRIAATTAGALLLFGIIQTWSRGATLAAILIMAVAAVRSGGRIPRKVWLLAGVGILLLAIVSSPLLVRKFLDRGQNDPYNYARIQIWTASLRVAAEHPWLGVGFGQFFHVSKRFNFPVEGQLARYGRHVGIAHSEYLGHIAEVGFPAAFLLFGLFGYLLYQAWSRANTVSAEQRYFNEAAILTAAGIGAHALVDNCWTVAVLASAFVVGSLADFLPLKERHAEAEWRTMKFAAAGVAGAFVYVHAIAIPTLAIYYNTAGNLAYKKLDFANAEKYDRQALAFEPDHVTYLDNLGLVYLDSFNQTKDRRLLDLAHQYFDRAIIANPHAVEPRIHMEETLVRSIAAKLAQGDETDRKIIENDTELLRIDPYIPFPRKNLAIAYYNLGQRDRAMEEMQKALDYEPNYVPAYLEIAAWYKDRGDLANSQRYVGAAMSIADKYRNFMPTVVYESLLLGRPESEWARE